MTEDNFWSKQLEVYNALPYKGEVKYESWQPARWASNRAMLERIMDKFNLNIKNALELGAGSAAVSIELSRLYNIDCTCIDLSKKAKEYALKIASDMGVDLNYIEGDFFNHNLEKTDLVFSLGVIEHFSKKDQIKYIKRCREISNKYILVAVPNQDSVVFKSYIKWCNRNNNNYEEEHNPLTVDMLEKIIKNEGFKILDKDGFQVLLSEGQFWCESDIETDKIVDEFKAQGSEIADLFPKYNFKFEDLEVMRKVENNISKEYRMKNSFMQYVLAEKIEPAKLNKGDKIAVVAPSRSMNIISESCQEIAKNRLNEMGLDVVYGKNVYDSLKYYDCGTIENRISDLEGAFLDKDIKGILTVIGGFNINQILPHINYDIIKNNPKMICGFSDITALFNAIYTKTGMITFYGPHFSTLGMLKGCEYTIESFKNMVFSDDVVELKNSPEYSDDFWFIDQENREFIKNDGMFCVNEGNAEGTLIGGNLCTFNLLQGTEFMPSLKDAILFIEDDDVVGDNFFREFDRNLVSLMQQPDFKEVKGIIVGRAQKRAEMDKDKWLALLDKKELKNIPVIAGVDFGHTTPIATIPIGGYCKITAKNNECKIEMSKTKF